MNCFVCRKDIDGPTVHFLQISPTHVLPLHDACVPKERRAEVFVSRETTCHQADVTGLPHEDIDP